MKLKRRSTYVRWSVRIRVSCANPCFGSCSSALSALICFLTKLENLPSYLFLVGCIVPKQMAAKQQAASAVKKRMSVPRCSWQIRHSSLNSVWSSWHYKPFTRLHDGGEGAPCNVRLSSRNRWTIDNSKSCPCLWHSRSYSPPSSQKPQLEAVE